MNSRTKLGIAALLATFTLPAFAQDTSLDLSAEVSVDASAAASAETSAAGDTSATADTSAMAAASGSLTFSDLVFDIGNDDWATDVAVAAAAMGSATINIVEVSSLEGGGDASAAALADAVTANDDRMSALRTSVAANAAIQAKLEESGHDTDDVVAVKSDASGTIWVYVDAAE